MVTNWYNLVGLIICLNVGVFPHGNERIHTAQYCTLWFSISFVVIRFKIKQITFSRYLRILLVSFTFLENRINLSWLFHRFVCVSFNEYVDSFFEYLLCLKSSWQNQQHFRVKLDDLDYRTPKLV